MSEQARDDLAAAANTVAGIRVTSFYRQTTDPGAGYVRLDRVEYPNRLGGLAYWDVVVLCPQELDRAERFLEEKGPALVAALSEEMTVIGITTYTLDLGEVGRVPGFIVDGHRPY